MSKSPQNERHSRKVLNYSLCELQSLTSSLECTGKLLWYFRSAQGERKTTRQLLSLWLIQAPASAVRRKMCRKRLVTPLQTRPAEVIRCFSTKLEL